MKYQNGRGIFWYSIDQLRKMLRQTTFQARSESQQNFDENEDSV
jgi:hypothetical protein